MAWDARMGENPREEANKEMYLFHHKRGFYEASEVIDCGGPPHVGRCSQCGCDFDDHGDERERYEFAVASVSSPGFEEYFPAENPLAVAAGLEAIIGPLKYANTGNRGYMVVTATPGECRADWHYVSTVKAADYTTLPGKSLPDGTPGPSLYCAVIVKTVDAQTRSKTGINELLRD